MKPREAAPLLTTLAPIAAAAPPVLIVGAIVGIGLWLLSRDEDKDAKPEAKQDEDAPPTFKPATKARRVAREDLAEALAYGAKRFTRKDAVAALEALGFRKTAAYKALARDGRFASMIELTPDGLIEWKG